MANLIERSILLTIGAASLTLDMTEAFAGELMKRGQDTTDESRKAMDELVERARDEARSFRGSIDSSMKKVLQDMGVPSSAKLEEIELKLAQLEHRISLLENRGKPQTEEESGG